MRPSILDPLFGRAEALPGVGPKTAILLNRLLAKPGGEARAVDLLFHAPINVVDRRTRPTLKDAPLDTLVLIKVRVAEHRRPERGAKGPFKVLVEDETGDAVLVFFLANTDWIERSLPIGATRWVSGRLELYDGHRQIVHPDRVVDEAGLAKLPLVEPVHGLTEGLQQRFMQKAIEARWSACRSPRVAKPFRSRREQAGRLRREPARCCIIHESPATSRRKIARQRLALDELLAQQLALRLMRGKLRRAPGREHRSVGRLAAAIEANLPFELTGAQKRTLDEIRADLSSDQRMLRLVQGDVGSGKTIVAALAMAHVAEAGRQAALTAPTEILARQHFERLEPIFDAVGLSTVLLTGRSKLSERPGLRAQISSGETRIIIGTHALITSGLVFDDLGLAVVDEQHRFGVTQRLALGAKGEAADVLVMTATPIPRSLALALFATWTAPCSTKSRRDACPSRRARCRNRASARSSTVLSARWRAARAPIGCARWSRKTKTSISPPPRSASRI